MAAGRCWGYRDNGSEDFESDSGMLRRDVGNFNDDYGRMRNRNREYGRGQNRVQDSLDHGVRVTQKDIKERVETNTGYNYTSNFSDSGHLSQTIDREPGELSSDDSDGAIDSEIALKKEIEFKKLDNEIQLSYVQNRRKFSPIVWNRDDNEVSRPVKRRDVHNSQTANLPPQPPSIKSHHQPPNSNPNPRTDANVRASPSDDTDVCVSEASPSENFSSLPKEHLVSKADINATDGDYAPVRTVISSRWANEAESPADEGEISDYGDTRISSRNSGSGSNVVVRKSVSPELGEVERGFRSSSRDSFADNDDKNDYMKIDDCRNYGGTSLSESDSEWDGTAQKPKRCINMLQSCRYVEDEFDRLNEINEGTYGVVFRAKDKNTGEIFALKKVKMEKEREGFPITSLREINILLSFRHPSIVDVKEVVMGRRNSECIYMVMEYMEHDLKGLLETIRQPFSQSEVKCLMLQLLSGVKYLHENWVIHRDLKTSNLLFDNRGNLKICDFGMARQYGSPLKPYTPLVVTLWYRAPEILLGAKQYSTAIDMWSVGCIMAELLSKEPLFNGKSELDQLDKIFRVLGTPNETIWPACTKLPGFKVNFVRNQYNLLRTKFPAASFTGSPVLSDAGFDLLSKLLTYDPEKRITAEAALNHEWFCEVPVPKSKQFMPTYPAQHDQDRRMHGVVKRLDPLIEQRRKELQQRELGNGGLFVQ